MARTIKLIMLSENNNNKYYTMTDNDTGTFSVEYGRVGTTKQTGSYPIGRWNAIYREKTGKGYKDVTDLFKEEEGSVVVDFADINDAAVAQLVARLQAYARKQIATSYRVTADAVTKKQIDEGQSILNSLSAVADHEAANKYLLELYAVIPRRMSNVKDHLLASWDKDYFERMLSKEQDLLDTMAGQVKQVELVKENTDDALTLLDALGLEIYNVVPHEVDDIKTRLADIAPRYQSSFRVTNKKTQKMFDDYVVKADNKRTELFFHGSRNENWISILETGLILRPTNAVISGKMFGYGTYFADKAVKSLGYTSARGSCWAHGSSTEAYMALFDVHLGNALHTKNRESWMGSLNEAQLKQRGNYDSLFAEGGADLRNNEYIVYREEQSTVKYIIQLQG
jgi:poly [ADP-ribose] polymerase